MNDDKNKSADALRKAVLSTLAALTPQEVKALRARFGIEPVGPRAESMRARCARSLEISRSEKKEKALIDPRRRIVD